MGRWYATRFRMPGPVGQEPAASGPAGQATAGRQAAGSQFLLIGRLRSRPVPYHRAAGSLFSTIVAAGYRWAMCRHTCRAATAALSPAGPREQRHRRVRRDAGRAAAVLAQRRRGPVQALLARAAAPYLSRVAGIGRRVRRGGDTKTRTRDRQVKGSGSILREGALMATSTSWQQSTTGTTRTSSPAHCALPAAQAPPQTAARRIRVLPRIYSGASAASESSLHPVPCPGAVSLLSSAPLLASATAPC
jgi:hypothetical protein